MQIPHMDDYETLLKIRDEGEGLLTPEEEGFLSVFDAPEHLEHYDNLASSVDEKELRRIAQDVIQWVDWDEDSRADWYEMESKGIRALGVTPNVDGGASFAGASKAVHPVLAEACVQFASRALESATALERRK